MKKTTSYFLQSVNIAEKKHLQKSIFIPYLGLGITYGQIKEWDKALVYYNEILKNQIAVFGDNHPEVADAYFRIYSSSTF